MQFEKLRLQRREISGRRPVAALLAALQRGITVWTMQSCNGRQAVMSTLEALVLAGKGLNAFSLLLIIIFQTFYQFFFQLFFQFFN
jgi:hypothetical protein